MRLTDREHTVMKNMWGEEVPIDLRQIDADQLWIMHDRVSKAVQLSNEDDDLDSLGILLPLETKITRTLYERI